MIRILIVTCACLLLALPAFAQSRVLAEAVQRTAATSFRNLAESAEKMPEADFAFQATKETRTFAGFVGHTINSAYNNCSRAKGEANPNTVDLERETSKARLVEAARAVQIYCDAVYAAQTDRTLGEMVTVGQNRMPRLQLLLRGIVPPTTERAQQPRPGRDE
jgi:hypothetical protein